MLRGIRICRFTKFGDTSRIIKITKYEKRRRNKQTVFTKCKNIDGKKKKNLQTHSFQRGLLILLEYSSSFEYSSTSIAIKNT